MKMEDGKKKSMDIVLENKFSPVMYRLVRVCGLLKSIFQFDLLKLSCVHVADSC